jgi:hypothetical protein
MINYNIPKPNVSAHFTIDDIHKIREWHYEQLKDATVEERMAYYNYSAHGYTDNNRKEG